MDEGRALDDRYSKAYYLLVTHYLLTTYMAGELFGIPSPPSCIRGAQTVASPDGCPLASVVQAVHLIGNPV